MTDETKQPQESAWTSIWVAGRKAARRELKSMCGSFISPEVADEIANAVMYEVLPLAESERLYKDEDMGTVPWLVYNAEVWKSKRLEGLPAEIRHWAYNYGIEDLDQSVMDELRLILEKAEGKR